MAKYGSIRIDVDKGGPAAIAGTIRLYDTNLNVALDNALLLSAFAGTKRMAERINKSATKTGRARKARGGLGPGRRKTDKMYRSIWHGGGKGADQMGNSQSLRAGARIISLRFGFLDAPYYTKYQEGGTRAKAAPVTYRRAGGTFGDIKAVRDRGKSGQMLQGHPGIKPMFAFQHGWNTVQKTLLTEMSKQAEDAKDAALAQRLLRRANQSRTLRSFPVA